MHKRQRFFIIFVIFFVLSLLVMFLFRTQAGNAIQGIFELVATPLQKITHTSILGLSQQNAEKEVRTLRDENEKLLTAHAKNQEIVKENQALRDQFSSSIVPAKQLLPATIIGSRTSDVGTAEPVEIILDKGRSQGVIPGAAVIYKDILVGQVVDVTENRSAVRLPVSSESSIPAKTSRSNALGIVKGKNNGVLFDNVLLSDTLQPKDIIVTKGDVDRQGRGYPPGLVIGKVAAVHKRASALFQNAEIDSVLSVNRLTMVFIHITN